MGQACCRAARHLLPSLLQNYILCFNGTLTRAGDLKSLETQASKHCAAWAEKQDSTEAVCKNPQRDQTAWIHPQGFWIYNTPRNPDPDFKYLYFVPSELARICEVDSLDHSPLNDWALILLCLKYSISSIHYKHWFFCSEYSVRHYKPLS